MENIKLSFNEEANKLDYSLMFDNLCEKEFNITRSDYIDLFENIKSNNQIDPIFENLIFLRQKINL